MIYPNEINSIDERFFRQAYETIYDNINSLNHGDTISAFNHSVSNDGYSPCMTTRPEGFKTAILVVEYEK